MNKSSHNVVPVREGLLTRPLSPLEQVRIIGSKCKNCGEVMLGEVASCANCACQETEVIPLSKRGRLWTYTIIRHRPPGKYRGPDPFVPFAEGLVELPEGIRVLSVLDCPFDKLEIGMTLELVVHRLYQNEQGNDVIAFKFRQG